VGHGAPAHQALLKVMFRVFCCDEVATKYPLMILFGRHGSICGGQTLLKDYGIISSSIVNISLFPDFETMKEQREKGQ
jgi:hypothetical protein